MKSAPAATAAPSLHDDKFWDLVEAANWKKDGDVERAGADLRSALLRDDLSMDAFGEKLHEKSKLLWQLVATNGRWIKAWPSRPSDDGVDDCINHIIGLGKAVFDAAAADVHLIVQRYVSQNFTESFAFVCHDDGDE